MRKTLTPEQRAEAAEPFGAAGDFLTARKKLVDTTHPAYKAVTAVRNKARSFWRSVSLPYPEPGLRLIRQDKIDEFAAQMRQFQEELAEAVENLDRHYSELKAAVRLAEEAFIAELAKLVSHLGERLTGQEDGKPKTFRNSAVENLTEFFQRFRQLNVRSSEQLDNLVADAQRIIRGVEPQALRDNQGLRQQVATEMSRVQSVLDGLLVDRPRRNILRRPK